MRFFVRLEVDVPPDVGAAEITALNAAETARGVELLRAGVLEQVWRVEGRRANVGIWRAESLEALHGVLDSLPMRRFVEVAEVEQLTTHPVTQAAATS